MGYERIARTVTARMTCDHCGKVEDFTTEYNPDQSVLPEPWVWIIGPVPAFSIGDLPEALVCSEECAVHRASGLARSIFQGQTESARVRSAA